MKNNNTAIPGTEAFIQSMLPYANKHKDKLDSNRFNRFRGDEDKVDQVDQLDQLASLSSKKKIKLCDKNLPITPSQTPSLHIKISVRLGKGSKGIVTSLTIKKNTVALWLLYTCDPEVLHTNIINEEEREKGAELKPEDIQKDKDTVSQLISEFVYKCLEGWDKETGRGLSDFVTELMTKDILDEEDHYNYSELMRLL